MDLIIFPMSRTIASTDDYVWLVPLTRARAQLVDWLCELARHYDLILQLSEVQRSSGQDSPLKRKFWNEPAAAEEYVRPDSRPITAISAREVRRTADVVVRVADKVSVSVQSEHVCAAQCVFLSTISRGLCVLLSGSLCIYGLHL